MAYREIAPFPKQLTIVVGLSVVGLMAFGLSLSYYKSVRFEQQVESMQERNRLLHQEIVDGYQLLEYFNSEQYKDKYGKQNFGLLNEGEKVIIFQEPEPFVVTNSSGMQTDDQRQAIFEENLRNIRTIDQWLLYLFEPEKVEDLFNYVPSKERSSSAKGKQSIE